MEIKAGPSLGSWFKISYKDPKDLLFYITDSTHLRHPIKWNCLYAVSLNAFTKGAPTIYGNLKGCPQAIIYHYEIASDTLLCQLYPEPDQDYTVFVFDSKKGRFLDGRDWSSVTSHPGGACPAPNQGAGAPGSISPVTALGSPNQAAGAGPALAQITQQALYGHALGLPGWGQSPSYLGGYFGNPSSFQLTPNGGMAVGELVGWRLWLFDTFGMLRSAYKDSPWRPQIPMEGNVRAGYGIFSYKEMCPQLEAATEEYCDGRGCVVGTVWLWGDVVEHEIGYRSQFASIRTIEYLVNHTFDGYHEKIQQIRSLYCPNIPPQPSTEGLSNA